MRFLPRATSDSPPALPEVRVGSDSLALAKGALPANAHIGIPKGCTRLINMARELRRQMEKQWGPMTPKQWKRKRRELRANPEGRALFDALRHTYKAR